MLGLPTNEDIDKVVEGFKLLMMKYENSIDEIQQVKSQFGSLRSDMSALYSEVSSDIKRVDKKVKAIKPILKVQDEEAVSFIKGILSKHDIEMTNNQRFLEESKRSSDEALRSAKQAVIEAKDVVLKSELANEKVENVLNGLGITPEEPVPHMTIIKAVREIIKNSQSEEVKQA